MLGVGRHVLGMWGTLVVMLQVPGAPINGTIVGHSIDKCLAFGAQFWRDYVHYKRVVYSDGSTCFAPVDISGDIGFEFTFGSVQ